jgi:hypothetical protein
MRKLLMAGALAANLVVQAVLAQGDGGEVAPVGASERIFQYRCDAAGLRFADMVTMQDGSRRLGKVMEWADQVLLYDLNARPDVFAVRDVKQFEFRRVARQKASPASPDLTVAFVERLPRDPSWQGHVVVEEGLPRADIDGAGVSWRPAAGSSVTFRVHVLNAGAAASQEVACQVFVDEQGIANARVPALEPGKEQVVEASWAWQDGPHALRIEIDPENQGPEAIRWNNTFVEPVQGLAVAVVIARERYEAFKTVRNVVDSFCFEDWVQYQLRCLNGLFRASRYPSAPDGALERVRCDRIVVVDDPTDATQDGKWAPALRREGRPDGLAEYAALLRWGKPGTDENLERSALRVDWVELQGLARQLGLIDLTTTDTRVDQCMAQDQRGRYVQCRHEFPNRATLMYTAGGFALDELSVGALNQTMGKPRGFRGDYLYQLPGRTIVEVLSNVGSPLRGVTADAFQLMSEGDNAGLISGYGFGDPVFSGETDEKGRFALPDMQVAPNRTPNGYELRPNPFGKIATDGSNGLLLLRLRLGKAEEFYFLRLYDCGVAFLRGEKEQYVRELATRFGTPEAIGAPQYTALRMPVRATERPPLDVCWRMPEGANIAMAEEFRVYRRTGLTDNAARPWTLVSVLQPTPSLKKLCAECPYFSEILGGGVYSGDTFFAASMVDREGRESSLSPPGCLAYNKDSISFAMGANDTGYITLAGDGEAQMLCWDGEIGTQHFGVRTRNFKGYRPEFAGIATTKNGRLVAADPANHVLAVYDRGDLSELIPGRSWWPGYASDEPGEFYEPSDVAIDDAEHILVADRNNNRVQILDSRGRFIGLLDEGFQFEGPYAVGYANEHVCVTDKAGSRCRVYRLEGTKGTFVRELPALVKADRALVSKTGKVYVAAKISEDGASGIIVFNPSGASASMDRMETKDTMGPFCRPRGLYVYGGGTDQWAYFVNEFPFDVHRIRLD